MKIGFGCDHAAIDLKNELIEYMTEKGYECVDYGTGYDENGEIIKCDYPNKGREVGEAVVRKDVDYGVLMCGTGIGISITANKFKGIRAALCSDCFSAEATRLHNNANILAMGGRVVGPGLAVKIVDTFLNTPFSEEERHIRRIKQMEEDTDIVDVNPEV